MITLFMLVIVAFTRVAFTRVAALINYIFIIFYISSIDAFWAYKNNIKLDDTTFKLLRKKLIYL